MYDHVYDTLWEKCGAVLLPTTYIHIGLSNHDVAIDLSSLVWQYNQQQDSSNTLVHSLLCSGSAVPSLIAS